MKTVIQRIRDRACGWLATLVLLPGTALAALPPEIVGLGVDERGAHVAVRVPAGIHRIVLESTRRGELNGWSPRVVRRLDGKEQTVVVDLPADAPHELVRVRADDEDPLPAEFYQGRTNVAAIAIASNGPVFTRNGGAVDFDAGVAPQVPGVGGGTEAQKRDVVESDIWKVQGSRLYFFNELRGLQVVDIARPDAPRLLGTLRFPAAGEQLYLPDDDHVVLMQRENCRGNGYGGAAVVIVDVSADQPREVTRLDVPGRLFESRMIGSALYVASQTYENSDPTHGIWELATVVSTFDLANPKQPAARGSRKIPGSATVVAAAADHFFVGLDVAQGAYGRRTDLHVLDASAADGTVTERAVVPLSGWLRDKFKIDLRGDVLRVLVEDQQTTDRWSPFTRLTTWRLPAKAGGKPERLGQLDLGAGENLFGAHFDGDRAYVVTYRRVDPLFIVDLADPTAPRILGELKIPGWSNYLLPMGDRLLTVGIDDTAGWRAAVQLFDVANPAKPGLLAKVPLGDRWSWSEANSDEKALGVFPDQGLVLIPFSASSETGSKQGVQLIDFGRDTIKARGLVEHPTFAPRRSTVVESRVLSLSARELITADIADRDAPKVVSDLILNRTVERVVGAGSHLLTFEGTRLDVVSTAAPELVLGGMDLGKLPVRGAERRGDLLHVIQGEPASVVWTFDAAANAWNASTNSGWLQLRVLSLAALPKLSEVGSVMVKDEETAGGDLVALWPAEGTLVWTSPDATSYYAPWAFDLTLRPMPAPAPVSATAKAGGATSVSIVGGGLDFAAPVDRGVWFPGRWWGQARALIAFDVSDPARPAHRSTVRSNPQAVTTSEAFRSGSLVFFTEEFQESTITGTNVVTWLESYYTQVTNVVYKTNITRIPETVWHTNQFFIAESYPGVRTSWPAGPTPLLVSAGAFHSLLVDGTGTLWTWGDTAGRRNPDGSRRDPAIAEPVAASGPWLSVAAGSRVSYGLDGRGGVWSWLSQDPLALPPTPEDAVRAGGIEASTIPAPVAGLPRVTDIAAGHGHVLASSASDARIWTWGANEDGQLGRADADGSAPAVVPGLSGRALAAGAYHSLVLGANGTVWAFGRNDHLQLGSKADRAKAEAARVPLPGAATAIAAGAYHGVALSADGTVWTWGRNTEGQLGRGDLAPTGDVAPVDGLPPVRAIAAGAFFTVALDADGGAWIMGQIEPSLAKPRGKPGRLLLGDGVAGLKAGRYHVVATMRDGHTVTFGDASQGQPGRGDLLPVEATFLGDDVVGEVVYHSTTNVVKGFDIQSILSTRMVTNEVPVVQWWQRHELRVVDYAGGALDPVVRPTLAFPGELRGTAKGGNLLYSRARRTVGTTEPQTREHLEASAYDGVSVFVGDSLALTDSNDETAHVQVLPEGDVAVARGSWNRTDRNQLLRIGMDQAKFRVRSQTALASQVSEVELRDRTLFVRESGGLEIWDLSDPTKPGSVPTQDVGCLWFDLNRIDGAPGEGWWVPGGQYGILELARP